MLVVNVRQYLFLHDGALRNDSRDSNVDAAAIFRLRGGAGDESINVGGKWGGKSGWRGG